MNKGIIIFVCLVAAYLFIKNKKKPAEQSAENSGGGGGGNGNPPIPFFTPIYPQPANRPHIPTRRPPVRVVNSISRGR